MHYMDEVMKELKKMGVKIELADDRTAWRHMVSEARPSRFPVTTTVSK